jgi:AcrR family transcriptional regulator
MTELRADAQRNLDRLLVAAGACFAERGVDVSIDEIARRAGVGHGTVFRRFPTKEALLEAVVCERARGLAAAAEEAAEAADVWSGFEGFVREAAAVYGRDRALLEGLGRCVEAEDVDAFVEAVRRLVARAQAAGVLRKDVSAEDVLDLVPAASRHAQVVLDGLRPVAVSV